MSPPAAAPDIAIPTARTARSRRGDVGPPSSRGRDDRAHPPLAPSGPAQACTPAARTASRSTDPHSMQPAPAQVVHSKLPSKLALPGHRSNAVCLEAGVGRESKACRPGRGLEPRQEAPVRVHCTKLPGDLLQARARLRDDRQRQRGQRGLPHHRWAAVGCTAAASLADMGQAQSGVCWTLVTRWAEQA